MDKTPMRLALQNPDYVTRNGVNYGGPLKLHHRTDKNSALPTASEYLVIKWPSYTQWSGVGARSSNRTEYWLVQVVREPKLGDHGFWLCRSIREITPGRKRAPVKKLIEECERLYIKEFGERRKRTFRVSGEISYPFGVEIEATSAEEAEKKVHAAGLKGGMSFDDIEIRSSPRHAMISVGETEEVE